MRPWGVGFQPCGCGASNKELPEGLCWWKPVGCWLTDTKPGFDPGHSSHSGSCRVGCIMGGGCALRSGFRAGAKAPAAHPSFLCRRHSCALHGCGWWVVWVRASSSVGQSTRLISVGSEVQVLPGPCELAVVVAVWLVFVGFRRCRCDGGVAQRESTCFASRGSSVRIRSSPGFGACASSGLAAPCGCPLLPENLPVGLLGLAGLSVLFVMVNRDLVCRAFGRRLGVSWVWRSGVSDLRTG
jgi:hypothetical protein